MASWQPAKGARAKVIAVGFADTSALGAALGALGIGPVYTYDTLINGCVTVESPALVNSPLLASRLGSQIFLIPHDARLPSRMQASPMELALMRPVTRDRRHSLITVIADAEKQKDLMELR